MSWACKRTRLRRALLPGKQSPLLHPLDSRPGSSFCKNSRVGYLCGACVPLRPRPHLPPTGQSVPVSGPDSQERGLDGGRLAGDSCDGRASGAPASPTHSRLPACCPPPTEATALPSLQGCCTQTQQGKCWSPTSFLVEPTASIFTALKPKTRESLISEGTI